MTFFEILSTLLIGPLKLIFEFIFVFAYKLTSHAGLSVVTLSIIMNCLLLPLYRRTDAIQEASRDTEAKLKAGVDHIKKSFSGDERMMILQTYYRQNNYKPTDALNGSVSLLLEVPFFMAAYQFLSNLRILEGVSFGPIGDLSAPDAMIAIGSLTINFLPFLMTVVNIVSSALYMKGFPLKSKLQLYAMALVFLVVLYNSPSGLVLYWTMNNLFSLGKTLFFKLKNPKKVAIFGAAGIGLALLCFALFVYRGGSGKTRNLAIAMGALLQLPLVLLLFGKKLARFVPAVKSKPDRKTFLLGACFLTILTGLLIPSALVAASPQDFVDTTCYYNPLWYCAASACLAAGTFLVWLNVFYWLADNGGRALIDKLMWVLCGVMFVNYMFFGTDLGIIRSNLQFENGMYFTQAEQTTNLLVLLAVGAVIVLLTAKWKKTAAMVLLTATIALGGMSVINVSKINTAMDDVEKLSAARNNAAAHFELSTTGKNVVVIMLDRAMGEYVPFMLQERPELEKQFAGFTYYANTISYGSSTNLATPALLGGYEYTPVEINKRDSEPLVNKQNEALKVMPVLFMEHGYKVTVCDPPYANYHLVSDVSIYDDYPAINGYVTKGLFGNMEQKKAVIENNHRNFFCYSVMKTLPLVIQPAIYNFGLYGQLDASPYSGQQSFGLSAAKGLLSTFMESFAVLQNLSQLCRITEKDTNTFLFMNNETVHEPMLLQTPDYVPAESVNNAAYDAENAGRFTVDGRTLIVDSVREMNNYHVNMAAMIQIGNWLDYLREQGVYDNTRIILVSDHAYSLEQLDELAVDNGAGEINAMDNYFPLLMVKDFGSQEFTTSGEFMTNADVPTLATDGLIENPVNPFTGKRISSDEKHAHEQMITLSDDWDVGINGGNAFLPSMWASVKDDIWNKENWAFSKEPVVLTEHRLPQ